MYEFIKYAIALFKKCQAIFIVVKSHSGYNIFYNWNLNTGQTILYSNEVIMEYNSIR